MKIEVIRTRKMRPPQDDLWGVMDEALVEVRERSVVVVTSKVVAIHQGRCVPLVEGGIERDELVRYEADWYARREIVPGEHILFSIKNQVLIASAGIDKSNADGYMVLWPNELERMVKGIWEYLRDKHSVRDVGVIVTDSHVVMMRRGTMGISLAHYGFNPVRNYVGSEDIFGRKLQVQVANVVDAMAAAAVLEMGEGDEQTPLAVITEVKNLEFSEDEAVVRGKPVLSIPLEEDLFEPMLSAVPWEKGRGGLTELQLKDLISERRR